MFFKQRIAANHIKNCRKASRLSDYNINPFTIKYIANFLRGDEEPKSIAEALIYPRILGTSISTSFGNNVQKFISEVLHGFGSAISGVDIEFVDQVDSHKKYAQIKLGPNCINKDDVTTIITHFKKARNIAKINGLRIPADCMVVGVLYGRPDELNAFYREINNEYPVYVGKDFWARLTGHGDFYHDLITTFGEVAVEIDGTNELKKAIAALEKEISQGFAF